MAHAITGPHHCIGAHRVALASVFARLRAACDAHGGSLSRNDLDAAIDAVEADHCDLFDRFDAAFRACGDARERSHGKRFDAAAAARFALFSACHYAIDEAFASQRGRAPRDWAFVLCEALIELGEGTFAPTYRDVIWNAYKTLAIREGDRLDVRSLAAAPEIRMVTRAFIGGFLQETNTSGIGEWLLTPLNVALSRKYTISAPHVLLVNGHQMRVFAERLWDDLAARLT